MGEYTSSKTDGKVTTWLTDYCTAKSTRSLSLTRATLRAFKPTKTNRELSVYDGNMIDAKSAWEHYVRMKGLDKSDGVMAVKDTECESLALTITSDPQPSFREHMLIGFDGLSKRSIKEAVRSLTVYANERNWCYHPN